MTPVGQEDRNLLFVNRLKGVSIQNTGNNRFSGDRFSRNDGFSGTKTPDDAISFTVSGITVIVKLFF